MRIDVERLRREARARAMARPRRGFPGVVDDLSNHGVPMRRYPPDVRIPDSAVLFLHAGYGLFGDLQMQDDYCRRLGQTLEVVVLSVDYRLAPEATLDGAVTDALTGLGLLADAGFTRLFLCGDSAGGAVATLAAQRTHLPLAGLLQNNPNLDLTLALFDASAPGGPDPELAAFAARAWTRVSDLADAPRLDQDAWRLPRTVVAVGTLDSLLPEARALAEACKRAGVECRLVEVEGAEHGFIGTDRVDEALTPFRALTHGE